MAEHNGAVMANYPFACRRLFSFFDRSTTCRGLGTLLVMRSHLSTWANVSLALAGPGFVAVLGVQLAPNVLTLPAHAIGLLVIVLITLGVYAWAMFGEGYALQRLGFAQCSWGTPLLAIALTAFFVLVFGPIAYWVLARSCVTSIAGPHGTAQLYWR
jgi:hypothetical protein